MREASREELLERLAEAEAASKDCRTTAFAAAVEAIENHRDKLAQGDSNYGKDRISGLQRAIGVIEHLAKDK